MAISKLPLALLLSSLSLAASVSAQDATVWGLYVFSRHGDRTSKATPPTLLTGLGYQEVLSSGEYYRSQYIEADAPLRIQGIADSIASVGQLAISSPADTVLQNSAAGFLQGLYPPVSGLTSKLGNGTIIEAPMGGFQLIPVGLATGGGSNENDAWLQSSTGCGNAVVSSNNFFQSSEYSQLYNSTAQFYSNLAPVLNSTFASSADNFKNAYSIFDYVNVAKIHNATIPSGNLLDDNTILQLRTLADVHEFGLAYNASDDARAISGMQLAGEIIQFFNSTISSKGAGKQPKLAAQFGAYGTFQSFFGLTNLTMASTDFYGIPDYASTMTFELFTNGTSNSSYPDASDLQIRFLFHNGTVSNSSTPTVFPLFGGSATSLSWSDFQARMSKVAVTTTQEWCQVCGNTTGVCAPNAGGSDGSSASSGSSSSSGAGKHMTAAIGGVIGAFVALAVVLGLEAILLACGGLTLMKKRNARNGTALTASIPAKV